MFHRETALAVLLPYTELGENGAEHILVRDLASDGAELVERVSEVERERVAAPAEREGVPGAADGVERTREVLPVALVDDDWCGLGRGEVREHGLDEPAAQLGQQFRGGRSALSRKWKQRELRRRRLVVCGDKVLLVGNEQHGQGRRLYLSPASGADGGPRVFHGETSEPTLLVKVEPAGGVEHIEQRVGPFDERFKITGDWEWCVRASQVTDFCSIDRVAGYFWLHGANISDTGDPVQTAEENIIRLMQDDTDVLIPVEPAVMRQVWELFLLPMAHEVEDRLWGPGAAARAAEYARAKRRARRRARMETAVRYIPRQVIDRTGLRPYLARFGIVKNHPRKNRI